MPTFILYRCCQRCNEWIKGAAPRHVCLSVNIWAAGAGCKDLKLNGQFYYTNADDRKISILFSPFWMNIIRVLSCAMFWSQIIKLLNSTQLLVHSQQGDWDHSGNLNVTTIWQIPFHPSLSTEKMRLFEYLQRLSIHQQQWINISMILHHNFDLFLVSLTIRVEAWTMKYDY